NRTGHAMENIVQHYLEAAGYVLGESLFKEIYQNEIEELFSVDLSAITNEGNTAKRFDFVIKHNSTIYLIEVNFYSS
ncbi:DpnII family type II restriction endonuclease, partial [Streptococcus suis]